MLDIANVRAPGKFTVAMLLDMQMRHPGLT